MPHLAWRRVKLKIGPLLRATNIHGLRRGNPARAVELCLNLLPPDLFCNI